MYSVVRALGRFCLFVLSTFCSFLDLLPFVLGTFCSFLNLVLFLVRNYFLLPYLILKFEVFFALLLLVWELDVGR